MPAQETTPSSSDDMEVDPEDAEGERPSKKAKVEDEPEVKKYVAPIPKARNIKVVRERSTKRLDVFVFGKGDMCELGLGPDTKGRTVTRPRLNPFLSLENVG